MRKPGYASPFCRDLHSIFSEQGRFIANNEKEVENNEIRTELLPVAAAAVLQPLTSVKTVELPDESWFVDFMKKILKTAKWIAVVLLLITAILIGWLRFGRVLDSQIYRASYKDELIESEFDFREFNLELSDETKIHAALFQPEEGTPIKATIFHHAGNGMSLNDSQKHFYKPLLQEGYQVVSYERRGYGKSTGKANNSQTLMRDANEIFDQVVKFDEVKDSKVIVWGTSIGGIFATANAAARNNEISGLIIESAFSSFPDVGKVYAGEVGLQNFKFVIPLIVNNDFPTNREIKKIDKPVVIIHSVEDKKIPFQFAENIFENSNKGNTEFWKITGKHVRGIINFEREYVDKFNRIVDVAQ